MFGYCFNWMTMKLVRSFMFKQTIKQTQTESHLALPIALKLFDIHPDFETSQRLANIYWAKADWENAKIYAMKVFLNLILWKFLNSHFVFFFKAQEINPRAWQPHHVLGFCFRGFGLLFTI